MSDYAQDGLRCSLATSLGGDVLIPVRFHAVEEISSLYEITVDAVSHDAEIDFAAIVGKPATLTISHEHLVQRYFSGIVSSFEQGGTRGSEVGELIVYRLTIVPWLWFLTLDSDCRVFEDKAVKDVVEDVFKRRAGDQDFAFELAETYSEKPYCVQYRETNFQFVSRLLEQEGIAYCFEHDDKGHKLVAFDDSRARPDCSTEYQLIYTSAENAERGQTEISEWQVRQVVPPGRCALAGYDFESPGDDNVVSASTTIKIGGNADREIFDYPPYYTSKDGKRYATVRMEELETASHQICGEGACMPLVPGTYVTLDGHYRKEFNGRRYLLTRVEHTLEQSIGNEGVTSYSNTFYCLPDTIKYRPRTTATKPKVQGSQTALVVGPDAEEIHCDKHGRVRIQFPWDRHGLSDGSNVCWARTSQSLAGPGWGGIFTPRIGQEVVVAFIEGDPDRPLISGVVYNGDNTLPYPLPASKTQSGIKTRSSKKGGADNYNEIRFEDKKGEESLNIHAERNMSTSVEADQSTSVEGNRSVSVEKDETITIKGPTGRKSTIETGKEHVIVQTGNREIEVETGDNLETIKTGKHHVSVETADALLDVRTGSRMVNVTAADYTVDTAAGSIMLQAKTNFVVDAKTAAQVESPDVMVKAKNSATIMVGQAALKLEPAKMTLAVGGSMVVLDPSGVTIIGPIVKIN